MKRLDEWLKRLKAKHWDVDWEIWDSPNVMGFFPSTPRFRRFVQRLKSLATSQFVAGVATGVLTSLIANLIWAWLS